MNDLQEQRLCETNTLLAKLKDLYGRGPWAYEANVESIIWKYILAEYGIRKSGLLFNKDTVYNCSYVCIPCYLSGIKTDFDIILALDFLNYLDVYMMHHMELSGPGMQGMNTESMVIDRHMEWEWVNDE